MKAPDKIYLVRSLSSPDKFHSHWFKEDVVGNGVEYIRKEALLEWAKECFRLQDKGSWYSKGAADAFSRVIDKLNEM